MVLIFLSISEIVLVIVVYSDITWTKSLLSREYEHRLDRFNFIPTMLFLLFKYDFV